MKHGKMFRRLKGATAVTVAVACASVPAATAVDATERVPAQPGAPPKPGGVALTWAPTHMSDNHEYSRARAVRIARNHDLVSAPPVSFADHVRAMRRVNPD